MSIVSSLSTRQIAALSTTAVKALTTTDIQALSTTQVAALSATQINAMETTDPRDGPATATDSFFACGSTRASTFNRWRPQVRITRGCLPL